jgi:hypothetical protein
MPSKLRYRHVFIAVGAVTTALILATFHYESARGRSIASAPEPAPPSLPVTLNVEPAICKDMYKIACQGKDLTRRDPTGLVRPDVEGEKIVVQMYKDIIDQHPNWSSEQVDDELTRTVFTPERRGRIEAAYHYVQYKIEHFIDIQPDDVLSAGEKKILKQRIQKTVLEIPPPASLYADEPDLLTKEDVFYERTSDGVMRMRVGGAYLFTAKSWFNMIFTMGHELGHAIDPCEIKAAGLSFPAYDRLTQCFLDTGIVLRRKDRIECEQNDQLSEAFADWIGSQITADALKTFSTEFHGTQLVNSTTNAVRDLCEEDDGDDLDVIDHPSPRVRIERIFGDQPEIRTILGCSTTFQPPRSVYCGFEPGNPADNPKKAPL